MLPRRISRHIVEQNWTGFAIDFLIVVVGVFVAIEVANWNEDRLLAGRQQTYFEQLTIDLEQDRKTAEHGLRQMAEIDRAANTIIAAMEGRPELDRISDEELLGALEHAGYLFIPQTATSTYDEMKSTGALGRIDDVELKRTLAEYYARAAVGRQWDGLLRIEQTAYREAVRGAVSRSHFAWARGNYHLPVAERDPLPEDFDRDVFLAEIRSRPEITATLASLGTVQRRITDQSETIREEANEMRDMVESVRTNR